MKNKIELKRGALRRFSVVFFWLLFLALMGLFFTNDFGIVDIHKTSIIVAVGIDSTENEVQVTAQLAVPKPSQSGDNIEYTEVQGSGETVADALNEINAKTGFYPQLQFCKLILLGDSCKDKNIFRLMGCFYRKNYSELTALVAMCDGKASETLGLPTITSDMTTTVIQRALADELMKSANVSTACLKTIAESNYSKSAACYMPFVEANIQGTSEEGGNGDNVGGEKPPQDSTGGEGSGSSSGGSGGSGGEASGSGSGGESGGSGGSGGSTGGASGGEKKPVEFTARRTAIFRNGMFAGILDEQEAFALDILKNPIRRAILPCDAGEFHYTLGLGKADGGIKVKIVDDVPELTLSFEAIAQIVGIKRVLQPEAVPKDDKVSREVLDAASKVIKDRMESLIEACVDADCDILGIKEDIYRFHPSKFENLKDGALKKMRVNFKINIKSRN